MKSSGIEKIDSINIEFHNTDISDSSNSILDKMENSIDVLSQSKSNSQNAKTNPKTNNPFPFPRSEVLESRITFLLIGMGSTLNWTVTLNCSLPIFSTIYNFPRGADTILLGYFLFSLIVAILRFYFRAINTFFFYSGLGLLYITSIILPLIVYLTDNITGVILLHANSAFVGLGVSLILSNGMAYASMIPVNMTGFVMAGQGLAGLFGFILWQSLTQIFFNVYVVNEIKIAALITFLICLIPLVVIHILFIRLARRSWFKKTISDFAKTAHTKLDPEYAKQFSSKDHRSLTYSTNNLVGCRPVKYLLKDTIRSMGLGLFTILITFSLFPNVGPYDWISRSIDERTIMVGTFQTIDFIGRLMPNINRKLVLNYTLLTLLVPCRLIFYPIFIVVAQAEDSFLSSFTFQMIIILLFAGSSGFISSQAIADMPRRVLTTAERGVIGLIFNIIMPVFLFIAIVLSQIMKYLYQTY